MTQADSSLKRIKENVMIFKKQFKKVLFSDCTYNTLNTNRKRR